jgi:polyisoprenoid-binding protein YceI
MKRLLLALALAAPLQFASAAERWDFDRAHTQVLFTVSHLGYTELTGQFRDVSGELMLDSEDLSKSSVTARINAASIDMNFERLEAHLKNKDFFDAENHADMLFTSTRVEKVADDRLTVHGDLSLLGKSLPVSLDVRINKLGDHPMSGKPYGGFTATTSIKRSDWGMTYGVPNVGDEIGIRINLEAKPAPAAE